MSTTIRLNLILQKLADGQEVVEMTRHSTGECLKNLVSRFSSIKGDIRDKRGRLVSYYVHFVNSTCAYPKQPTTPVKDGDKVEIETVVPGG